MQRVEPLFYKRGGWFRNKIAVQKSTLSFGLIILFSIVSMVLISWVIASFLSLQTLSTQASHYAETWSEIGRSVQYMSSRIEGETLNDAAVAGFQAQLHTLLEDEAKITEKLNATLEGRHLFWSLAGLSADHVAQLRKAAGNAALTDRLIEVVTARPTSVHSSLAFWPTELSVTLRTQSSKILALKKTLIRPALSKALVDVWWLIAFVFVTLTLAIGAVWKFLMVPTMRSLHATEATLRAQQNDLRLVLNNVPTLICWIDETMHIQTVNATFQNRFEKAGNVLGRHIKHVLGQENWDSVADHFKAASFGAPRSFDIAILTDGVTKTYQVNLVPEPGTTEGTAARIYVTFVDIEDRIETERFLRRSQQNLSTLLNSIGDGLIAFDHELRVTQFNQVAEKLTGQSRSEVEGKLLSDVVTFWDPDTQSDHVFDAVVERAARDENDAHLELELIPSDGTRIAVACSVAPVVNHQGESTGAVIVFRDISVEKRLRERAHHNDKMNTIGQLAGGVAHDFNNMLGGILVQLDLLRLQNSDQLPKPSVELIDSMLRSVERARELTHKLTAFARVETLEFRSVDITVLISDTLRLVKETADRRITVSYDEPVDEIWVHGNASALQAVVLNIMLNGVQAMRDGGKLSVTTRRERHETPLQLSKTFQIAAGDYAVISITDTGVGISEKAMEQIFEPFYTTKQCVGGTGLGLAAAYGTLSDHKGGARVSSQIGIGSTFDIFLPIDATTVHTKTATAAPIVQKKDLTSTIFLVDDEESLRTTVSLFLEYNGYGVITAEDGQQAVDLFDAHSDLIDLCILDVNLPGLNGYQVYQHIKKVRPECPVVFATGFHSEDGLHELVKSGTPMLQKPYRLHEISDLISSELG